MGQREILLLISRLLSDLHIPYLLTGSFASSYYGFPRATHDIDFVVEVETKDYPKLADALSKLKKDFLVDLDQVKLNIKRSLHFEILHTDSMVKVDFWPVMKNEFNESRLKRMRELLIFGERIPVISSEDLILTKLLWCKKVRSDRHIRDCVGIWQLQREKLDKKYLTLWAKKLRVGKLLDEISTANY